MDLSLCMDLELIVGLSHKERLTEEMFVSLVSYLIRKQETANLLAILQNHQGLKLKFLEILYFEVCSNYKLKEGAVYSIVSKEFFDDLDMNDMNDCFFRDIQDIIWENITEGMPQEFLAKNNCNFRDMQQRLIKNAKECRLCEVLEMNFRMFGNIQKLLWEKTIEGRLYEFLLIAEHFYK